jgi:hypothetical protein
MPNVLRATGGRGDASCVWSCAPPNFSRLQAQRIYDRLRKRFYSLNHLIDGLDVLGNGVLSGSRVGYSGVVKLRHWSGAAVGFGGDPHHLAALLQCFIGHALKVPLFAATFNPESRCLIFKLTHYPEVVCRLAALSADRQQWSVRQKPY